MDFAIEIYNTPLFETSCLLGNFAQEISATNDELRNLCNGYLAQQVAIVKKQFDEAKVFHSTISKIDTSSLASSLIAVIQGSILLAKASQDRNMIKKSLEHYRKYIRMLFQG
jgi:TetR/AcrR family transcriptional repressor of nem operon